MLSERVQSDALTVTDYSVRLGRALREVGPAVIEGEVQKVSRTQRGMLYFDLTDGEALLTCKVFPRDAAALAHKPKAGDLVQVHVDRPDFYVARGSLSLIVSAVQLAGEGELLRRRAELLERLKSEGLCDERRRRPLPRFPRAVGVIAGEGSDGMSDVIRALGDRWPAVHVIKCASPVQGKAAPRQLIDALARLQNHPLVDVIVMARGGGSVQDLACFDDEGLCRAAFACEVPVVCAIGHTENAPVINFVAWPAYTPSQSAELVVPSAAELRRDIAVAGDRLRRVSEAINFAAERVVASGQRLDCGRALDALDANVHDRASELTTAVGAAFLEWRHSLEQARGILAVVPHLAGRELASERETLAAAGAVLARTSESLARVLRAVHELGARVQQGTRRQLADHARDYGRAVARLMGEATSGYDRRDARARELVSRDGQALAERAHRHLDDAQRDTAHQAELIAAHDFRRRGWLLASIADGTPARSASDLETGTRIHLQLHDGRAQAVVENIDRNDGSSDA